MAFTSIVVIAVAIGAVCGGTLHLSRSMGPSSGSRIINGEQASPGEFPHQVTLLRDGYHTCGGSIIANGWAITASHCVDGQMASSLAVVVDLHSFSNPGNYLLFDVAEVIMHNKYNTGPGGFPNDVALLRLNTVTQTADITKNIIEIAPTGADYSGQTCTISGWGVDESGSGSSVLLKADVTALTKTQCQDYWGTTNILDQHLCVKGYETANGSGSCNGDSGGPLVCQGKLAGVTSWGRSGCHVGGVVTHPSVYAKTAYFRSWVNTNCGGCIA
ncbi:TRY7-like protein [Mya arenaria]|uniref:TRY7-like protein n=2 Tax=Mya arenaria TaxID=6604 RepID=A0ABY7EY23_MYAAR|nr:fibrinolytic enzyme, isozyme C-like [Mya arenaria]WAR14842.1 TRY7-like protein [Mya arenaria]WAR14843.1 TRY7-like protein [Mya arenaria]